jgi:hypothetical protein
MAASLIFADSFLNLFLYGIAALAVYTVTVYIYRIWFSPLSSIPGPKLAAATRWYEFYFDAIKVGKYYAEVERMHEVYGRWTVSQKIPDES